MARGLLNEVLFVVAAVVVSTLSSRLLLRRWIHREICSQNWLCVQTGNNFCIQHVVSLHLSNTEMALFSGRPQNFVGIHFSSPPVQVMQLVEVIRTEHTHPTVFDKVSDVDEVPTLSALSSIACSSRVSCRPCQRSIVTMPRSRTLTLPLHLSDYIG
jgi:hypothetical protein